MSELPVALSLWRSSIGVAIWVVCCRNQPYWLVCPMVGNRIPSNVGAWLARRIIAEPPDDPPPNVPNLKQETEHLPLRERLAQHRNQPGCAQCHAKIDPYGIPLEEYDAGGRRVAEPGDVRSTLPDTAHVSGAMI